MRACVCNARGLRASRLNDVEAGRNDADRDGHSWLQRHSWGISNGRNGRPEVGTRTGKERKVGCIAYLAGARPGGVMYMYARREAVF